MKSSNNSWLKDLFEPLLKSFANQYYSPRTEFNKEAKEYVFENKDFIKDVREVRSELNIPKLNPDDDFRLIPIEQGTEIINVEDSGWVQRLSNEEFDRFDQKVKWLLQKYELPLNFRDPVEFYLLYRKKSKRTPLYNLGLFSQIIQNPNELKRIPLTTGEKKLIKQYVLDEYGERIKKDKKLKNAYKELLQSLALSKNKRRRMRTISTALKATNKPKRHVKYYDAVKGKDIEPLYTFEDLAPNLIDIDMKPEEAKRKAATLRKQKQRLKERHQPQS